MSHRESRPIGPLAGVRVLDLSRLAPGPYGTMLLADLGAEVVMIGGGRTGAPIPALRRGKHAVELNLKDPDDRALFDQMVVHADVVVDSFRPGVAERLGIDHARLSRLNEGIITCSVTGYGADGPLAARAGHDINYLAVAGALGTFGAVDAGPTPPQNLLADFAGGGLLAAFGILAALYERSRSGRGQHVDAAMIDGVLSMMAMPFADWGTPTLPARGAGLLSGMSPAYRTYECADGRYVAVGALEPQFFAALWDGLGFDDPAPNHLDPATYPDLTRRLEQTFLRADRDTWTKQFVDSDACVTPVLEPHEISEHEHLQHRHPGLTPDDVPVVPRLSRGPAATSATPAAPPEPADTASALLDFGLDVTQAEQLAHRQGQNTGDLSWPPIQEGATR